MAFRELKLMSTDGLKLQGWFMHQHSEPENAITIVFCHENAGNIGLRMDWFEQVYKRLGVNIVAVAYRGYSRSEGEPNQDGILRDMDQVIEFCKSEPMIN